MKRDRAMNLKLTYTLLTLVITFAILPAAAQTNKKNKHKIVKAAPKKAVAKQVKQPAKPYAPVQKASAGSLGEAIENAKADTSKNKGNNPNTNSLSEEIVVTTAYKPVLADAVKIRINPDLNDNIPFKAPLTYVPVDKRLEQNTDIKQIEAMKKPVEKDSDLYNNYLKVGLGNLKTTYGEAYFNNGHDEGLQIGAFLKHLAQNGGLFKQNAGKEQADIFGKSIGKDNTLSGRIDYSYLFNYNYGFNPTQSSNIIIPQKQHFSILSGEANFAKNFKDIPNDLTYALNVKGYVFNNAFQAKESSYLISGFLNETINQFYAGLSASLDLGSQQDSLYNINNDLVRLNPYLKFQGDSYKFEGGINIVDQFGSSSSFKIFPAVKLEYQVVPKYVRLFAEAKGDINKTSLLGLSEENPFLEKDVPLKNSTDQLDLAAGIKGTIIPQIGFKITGFINSVKNMPLIVSDFTNTNNRFTLVYDNGTAKVSGVKAEFDVKLNDDVDIFGKAEFLSYKMDKVAQAWNLPGQKYTGGTSFRISNSLKATATLIYRGETTDPYIAPGSVSASTIKSFVDFGGSVEFKASNRISIFVNANNILNTNNQQWLYYSAYGFNIFGGISLGF